MLGTLSRDAGEGFTHASSGTYSSRMRRIDEL